MIYVVIWTAIFTAATGLILKLILDWKKTSFEITWFEFGITMIIVTLIVAPATGKIGWELAKTNLVTYREYWNGWETQAVKRETVCHRDGYCAYSYECDPYVVPETYSCDCDDDGCDTCTRLVTKYHDCPYVEAEYDYTVNTTIGEYTIAVNRFPDNPQSRRWRKDERIPASVIQRAGTGDPKFWTEVKSRLASNDPGPVTARREYENYILASEQTILRQYSGDIQKYQGNGLMPRLNSGYHDYYRANKVYFVGFKAVDPTTWQTNLEYLNAALGSKQGDVHLVLVDNPTVTANPDAYALALKAYWQDSEVFGKDSLSKNGIVIIAGTTDGQTIAWSRAFTGMPLGNEGLAVYFRESSKGRTMSPQSLIGIVRNYKPATDSTGKYGLLFDGLWGISDSASKFTRFSMSGNSGIGPGFLYLRNEIRPKDEQMVWIYVSAFFFSLVGWIICIIVGQRVIKRSDFRNFTSKGRVR